MKDDCNEATGYRFAKRLSNTSVMIFAVCLSQLPVPVFARASTPRAPVCHLARGGAQCGLVSFRCRPFSILDQITIEGFNLELQGIGPDTGVINAEYFDPGIANIRICASRDSVTHCGKPIPVTFPPPFCPPPGGRGGGGDGGRDGSPCRISDPECHPK
jgi:hypothetical protein